VRGDAELSLCEAARKTDAALVALDHQIDWLGHLSPTGNAARWKVFKEGGYRRAPDLTYCEIGFNLDDARAKLLSLPITEIENPRVESLLRAKQGELDLQLNLLRTRNTDGFITASLELFGSVEARLSEKAVQILNEVEAEEPLPDDRDGLELARQAEEEIERYREEAPNLWSEVRIEDDVSSMIMVNHGHLLVDRYAELPEARIRPLIAHEVGIHVVTRYNGYCQPLRLLEVGTAHYDPLQEGLGVFAEYLSGFLPPSRLRILAARVIACEEAVQHRRIEDIFALLHEEHGIPAHDAFDTAVRAKRGGGLTKDACYLRGLDDLLATLRKGTEFEHLLAGKYDLGQHDVICDLLEEGLLEPPRILPHFLRDATTRERLRNISTIDLHELHQAEPQP
jgi:uncharacterized protein (TIGR02421 family)